MKSWFKIKLFGGISARLRRLTGYYKWYWKVGRLR